MQALEDAASFDERTQAGQVFFNYPSLPERSWVRIPLVDAFFLFLSSSHDALRQVPQGAAALLFFLKIMMPNIAAYGKASLISIVLVKNPLTVCLPTQL